VALVLRERQNRRGETKRFDVVRAEAGSIQQVLEDIPEGQYRIMDGVSINTFDVSYRTVQDIVPVTAA
jgi:hypothetical protein